MCEAIFDGKDNRGVVWDRFPVRSAKPLAAVQAKEGIRLCNRDTVFQAEAAEFGAIGVKAGVAVHAGTSDAGEGNMSGHSSLLLT